MPTRVVSPVVAVQNFYTALADQDQDAALELLHDEVEWIVRGNPAVIPWAGRRRGKEAVVTFFETVTNPRVAQARAFEVKQYLASGEDVAAIGHFASGR